MVAASLSVHCTSKTVVKACGHLVPERWCKSRTGNKQRGLSEKVNIKPWLRHTQHTSEPSFPGYKAKLMRPALRDVDMKQARAGCFSGQVQAVEWGASQAKLSSLVSPLSWP